MARTLIGLISAANRHKKKLLFNNALTIRIEQLKISRSRGFLIFSKRSIQFSAITTDSKTNNPRRTVIRFLIPKDRSVNEAPRIAIDDVEVFSNSPWFKFAYGFNNKRVEAHFGRVQKFKVKGTGRPVNPKNFAAIDKHIIALTRHLKSKRLISGSLG